MPTSADGAADAIDLDLLRAWLEARSVARGLPLPVLEHGGLRLDANLPNETRRHLFAGPAPVVRALAASITAPRIPINARLDGRVAVFDGRDPRRADVAPCTSRSTHQRSS